MERIYGVSYGNGNDGVSHTYADFYVKTSDPWTLARAALISQIKIGYVNQAIHEMDVDGEADCTISATLLEPLDADPTLAEDGGDGSWSDYNGAWMICEVFPEDEPRDGVKMYESLEEAFDAATLKRFARD